MERIPEPKRIGKPVKRRPPKLTPLSVIQPTPEMVNPKGPEKGKGYQGPKAQLNPKKIKLGKRVSEIKVKKRFPLTKPKGARGTR